MLDGTLIQKFPPPEEEEEHNATSGTVDANIMDANEDVLDGFSLAAFGAMEVDGQVEGNLAMIYSCN